MLSLLTPADAASGEKSRLLFQLLHGGEVENSWSVPLLETIYHSYMSCRDTAFYGDPPMELYLWTGGSAFGGTAQTAERPAAALPTAAVSGEPFTPSAFAGEFHSLLAAPPGVPGEFSASGGFSGAPDSPPSTAAAVSGENLVEPVESPPLPAALALTGDTLTLCAVPALLNGLDRSELDRFAQLHRVRRIECGEAAAQWLSAGRSGDFVCERRPAMCWRPAPPNALSPGEKAASPNPLSTTERAAPVGEAFPTQGAIPAAGAVLTRHPRPEAVFALLVAAYPGFSLPREFWLYDTSRRLRRDCARLYGVEGPSGGLLATAGCYAKGAHAALLSGVATHPDARRRGYGSLLVSSLAEELSAGGKTVWIVPVDFYAQRLYSSLGFTLSGSDHCILQSS